MRHHVGLQKVSASSLRHDLKYVNLYSDNTLHSFPARAKEDILFFLTNTLKFKGDSVWQKIWKQFGI